MKVLFKNNQIGRMLKSPDLLSYAFLLICLILISTVECGGRVDNEGLYKLLGISNKATTKEIRMAFKKIALIKHPDKNPDDPNANEEFVKINRAYEILKDEELRKKYDNYGEDGLKDNHNAGQQYQNWNFYHQNFGIYDDDPEVITLTRTDFVQMVETNTDIIWFVNFYSSQCSHCHELAPTWRTLAKQLEGVVRIGAVNCGDDWALCQQQQIHSFPSLIMYPKRVRFESEKTLENLLFFSLKFAQGKVINLNNLNYYSSELNRQKLQVTKKPWLITYCLGSDHDEDAVDEQDLNFELNCLEDIVKLKIAISLDRLVNVGSIDCAQSTTEKEICEKLRPSRSTPILYYASLPDIVDTESEQSAKDVIKDAKPILTSDYKEISTIILKDLPDKSELDEERLNAILSRLRDPQMFEKTWLIQFVNEYQASIEDLEFKKLPVLFGPDYNFGRIDCSKLSNPQDCFTRFQVHKYPTFLLFKSASYVPGMINDNWFEIYYNTRITAADLTAFVKENAYTSVRSLQSGHSFDSFTQHEGKLGYFVDFFAPWCPPCMALLPEFRKASKSDFNAKHISFGTVDCTINQQLCTAHGVQSYPTTLFFYKNTQSKYFGQHLADDISDFIQDVINPVVVTLTYESFHKLVAAKPIGKVWFVDFFANWCGPCQQLAPEWRKLGKRLNSEVASIGQVDCVTEQRLCAEQGVTGYPNIRAYPADTFGTQQFHPYQGWMRDANNLHQWAIQFYPTKTVNININNYERLVLNGGDNDGLPWLLDFYAPWCGPCNIFAPKFEALAERLEGIVRLGKVNCQEQQGLCQRAGITGYPSIMFYPRKTPNAVNSWNRGEKIMQYEVEALVVAVNEKLRVYGYSQHRRASLKEEL